MLIRGKKVLIIKLGAIGDVLRTTPILRVLRNCDIVWITGKESHPILKNNPYIGKLITLKTIEGRMEFDCLYNFDEDNAACSLAESFKAPIKKGYGLRNGTFYPFDKDAEYAFELSRNDNLKFKQNKKTYQQIIFEMAGYEWAGEDYVLGYKPKNKTIYKVGLNHMVGEKFPNKVWSYWEILADMLSSVSMQKEYPAMEQYIDWINSCEIIVTSDSLGMHIALALKKKVIVLMGCTSWLELELYGRGVTLKAGLICSPCYKKIRCDINPSCMDLISVKDVYTTIKQFGGA